MKRKSLWIAILFFAVIVGAAEAAESRVTLLRTPEAGIQPRAAVGSRGRLHLIYFKGDPKAGDLFYVSAPASAAPAWSQPVRVNRVAGAAMATGSIRGAQLAIGKNDRVHVVWNQMPKSPGAGEGGMAYTRTKDSGAGFDPERNVVTWAGGLDGGGAVAADRVGNVYVAWHANAGARGEAQRAVFLARSVDDGGTFERERRINRLPSGACGCCGLGAMADDAGNVYVQYRAAEQGIERDTTLLVSRDRGATFAPITLQRWHLNACPMSSQAMAASNGRVFLGWETDGQIFTAAVQPGVDKISPPEGASSGKGAKHPAIAVNASGERLVAWTTGTGWARGGGLAWQLYDADGRATAEHGETQGVPVWSFVTAVALPDGTFAIIY